MRLNTALFAFSLVSLSRALRILIAGTGYGYFHFNVFLHGRADRGRTSPRAGIRTVAQEQYDSRKHHLHSSGE